MKTKSYIWFIIILCGLAFVINRHIVRPIFYNEVNESGLLTVIVYSLPNFVEAIIGTLYLAGIMFALREHTNLAFFKKEDSKIFLIIFVIALIFTFLQEMNWLNYRPDNVVDLYDFIATLTGLIIMNQLMIRFGFMEAKKIKDCNEVTG